MTSVVQDRWSDQDAAQAVEQWSNVSADLALRVYTSRLIGADTSLVLHGGGNTSVKLADGASGSRAVLAVKGSGWNLATIEPDGFPLVDLAHCVSLRQRDSLSDRAMVNELRTHMLDASAANPSVEALLHAFLPHRYVDHSHADAILALADLPADVAARVAADAFGARVAIVPYIMPGFKLAIKAAEVYEANPDVDALLLLKHGLFTFADTAKASYLRHIELVNKAAALVPSPLPGLPPASFSYTDAASAYLAVAPVLRAALARAQPQHHWFLVHRADELSRVVASEADWTMLAQRGPLTPDHVIRTKGVPCIIDGVDADADTAATAAVIDAAISKYADAYNAYVDRNAGRLDPSQPLVRLDPLPRVFLIPGVGLVCAGTSFKAARIADDIMQHTLETIRRTRCLGEYTPVNETERFDMEYWSLEQAKLGRSAPPVTSPHCVVLVTGAASGIGRATALAFARRACVLFLVDRDAALLEQAAAEVNSAAPAACKNAAGTMIADVTDPEQVRIAVDACVARFGGLDVLVSNAGAAFQADIATCDDAVLRSSFELNFFAHQSAAAASVAVMRRQLGLGGVLLFNASKSVLNPGARFGPYTIAKAATVALMKQYALEHGADGIRSNAVMADRVRTRLFTPDVLAARAKARGLAPEQYLSSNLLRRETTADDVARAFVCLAESQATTAAMFTVDGGNIAASLR